MRNFWVKFWGVSRLNLPGAVYEHAFFVNRHGRSEVHGPGNTPSTPLPTQIRQYVRVGKRKLLPS